VIYYVSHNPNVKQKLIKEIDSIFKNDPTRPITLEDIDKLKYCEAIIKETLRIRPVVNMMARYSAESDQVAGYEWPAGTQFHMNFRAINNNKTYWDNPEVFDPERFMSDDNQNDDNYLFEDEKVKKMTKYSFVIFGGGLRICPGRKLAMIELKSLMALIYRRFDIKLEDMNKPLKVKSTAITFCQELKIIPTERKDIRKNI